MVLFPTSAISTIGLQFLAGDSTAQFTSMRKRSGNFGSPCIFQCSCSHWAWGPSPSWDGTPFFAERGTKNFLLAAPALQPLPNSMAHFVYFVKEVLFYMLLILTPIIAGMALGILLDGVAGIRTLCFEFPSWTWLAMSTTLGQGLALSFLASSLWLRGRPYTVVGPVVVVALGIGVGLGYLPADVLLLGSGRTVKSERPSHPPGFGAVPWSRSFCFAAHPR